MIRTESEVSALCITIQLEHGIGQLPIATVSACFAVTARFDLQVFRLRRDGETRYREDIAGSVGPCGREELVARCAVYLQKRLYTIDSAVCGRKD